MKNGGDRPLAEEWHRQGEQSAGALRIGFLWLVYRWFGKGFQKLLCVPVMLFIYPFARPAKAALRKFYRVLNDYNGLKGFKGLKEKVAVFRHLLGVSLVALVVLVALLFRRKALRIAAPVLAALAAAAGTLGWLGIPITFFTLLCVFVLAGLGMDYSIFQVAQAEGSPAATEGHATSRAVFYSFLTSFVGLGALALTDFAVTRDMGVTFAVGLAFAYLSCVIRPLLSP